jgi:N-acetylmuramoyl-L-alanine amidase
MYRRPSRLAVLVAPAMRMVTVVAGMVRACGRVAVIAAAVAALAAGTACSLASAPRVRPADPNGTVPAAGPHSVGARTGGGGQGQTTGAEIDPAYFSPGACVAFPPTMGNRHLTVFLDAGHGGPDPGAVGITSTGQVIYEADQTLPVVLDTTTILRRDGFRVVVSRTGPTSVLRLGPGDMSGRVLSITGSHDDVAARDVCANMAQGWQIPDDGVQPDQGLGSTLTTAGHAYGHLLLLGPAKPGYFSTPSTMPGALIEPLFITDPFEGSIAASSHGQQVIAAGLASAITQYFAPGSTS